MKYYKFLRLVDGKIKSDRGNHEWEIGKEYTIGGKLDICNNGFHCSNKIGEAFSYVQGEILAEVKVGGEKIVQNDKSAHEKMTIVKAWNWTKNDSVEIAIYSAELCIANYEKVYPSDDRPRKAIEAAKAYLANPTEKNRSAAESAWSAAESAARSAAWSAWSAARSAAESAWSAAESAARSAAESARSAAESAWSAAESAARSAAESATFKKIYARFDKQLKKLTPYDNKSTK